MTARPPADILVAANSTPRAEAMRPHFFCPTDFSVASHAAFQHALGLALAFHGKITLMHVASGEEGASGRFPGFRAQLERWGRLPVGSPESAVAGLGFTAEKVVGRAGDPVEIVLNYLENRPADMIVLSTHQRDGHARWLGHAVAEPLARESHATTLFLPQGQGGFVSPIDGSLHLQRILIPVCAHPSPQPAVDAVVRLLKDGRITGASVTIFHVGPAGDMPALEIPAQQLAASVTQFARAGDPVEGILAVARETTADLVVMSTAGHHGFLDALRGSTTERVLRRLACPLLAVPAFPADSFG